MAVAFRRGDADSWPAVRRAIRTHWQRDHPLLDRGLYDWQYRGYGEAADGNPWAFIATDGAQVVSFVGLIPGMVRHVTADGVTVRPQALVGLWFTDPGYRAAGIGVLLLRQARRELDILGSLGVNPLARSVFTRLGFDRYQLLRRWVAPLDDGYRQLLVSPPDVGAGAVEQWLERVPTARSAESVTLDPVALARIAADVTCGLDRSAEFYRWRYKDSVGHHYSTLRCDDGWAIVRVEQPSRPDCAPVLRIIELLASADAAGLVGAVLAWGRSSGCCAADFQLSPGDELEPALAAASMRATDAPRPETALAELLRPYRPKADPINVIFAPDANDCGAWRFLKSDGDMDRSNEPAATED